MPDIVQDQERRVAGATVMEPLAVLVAVEW
jgi:hypothetical protein